MYGNITASDVYRQTNYSPSYVSALFHRTCGMSIVAYIHVVKITEAKNLIRKDTCNYTQISIRLGYSNQHYFSRVFRRVTGMSPSEYRSSVQL